jgi:hypothetical protein
MPERIFKDRQKYDSAVVQGEGSWVEIRNPGWDEIEDVSGPDSKMEDLSEMEMGKALLMDSVVDWNWVDDDGEPMPKPTPEIVAGLRMQELVFLFTCINVGDLDPKVSPPKLS